MNIAAVRVRNFRGFRDAAIELKPLTVLLGPNSAGKSSFSHALAALAHAQWIHAGTRQMTLTPKDEKSADEWPIDLGQHADLCTTGCNEPVQVEFRTSLGDVAFGFGCLGSETDLRLSYLKHPLGPNATLPHSGLDLQSKRATGATSTTAIPSPDMSLLQAPVGLELRRIDELNWRGPGKDMMRPQLSGLLLEALRYETGTDVPVDTAVKHELGAFLEGVTYLRASRKRPARGYSAVQTGRSAIGYAGERTAHLLMTSQEQVTVVKLPRVPNSAAEAVSVIDAPGVHVQAALPNAVGAWLSELGLASSVETRASPTSKDRVEVRIVLREGTPPRDITEVGYGLSQVIPVLVGGLIQSSDGLLIVDLPEAHLHPRPQALMADFFCAMVLSGRSALIETHSEMFFHRLRLRAAMSEELRDKIGVYFFDPHAGVECSPPRRVGLEQPAELKWPVGFLQEAWELEMQITAVREGRRLKYGDRASA